MFGRHAGAGRDGWRRHCRPAERDLRQLPLPEHSGGQETLYAHLQYLFVRAGEVVQAGQPLGTAGETGRSTGAHLHFELLEQGVRYDAGALLGLP